MKWIVSFLLCLSALPSKAQWGDLMLPIQTEIYSTPASGYIFNAVFKLDLTGDYPSNMNILDSAGNYVFFRPLATDTAAPFLINRGVTNFELHPNGLMSFSENVTGDIQFHVMDSTFNVVKSMGCDSGHYVDIHEFIALDNGDFIMLCSEERPADLSAFTTVNGTQGQVNGTAKGNIIQRFDAAGNLIFEWKTLDVFPLTDTYFYTFYNPAKLDHAHTNSVEVDSDGNYIVSSRALNEVTKINSQTGQIIWRLGGKNNQFTFVGDTLPFNGQHDARRLENGNILMFDNAFDSPNPIARAIEYDVDTTNMTATLVWEMKNPYAIGSGYMGSSRRLENGNTFINWGGVEPFSSTKAISEVDANGTLVMDIDLPDDYLSYRTPKMQLPFVLPQPNITCNGTQLSVPDTYTSYLWSTGDTTNSIVPTDTGSYHVWVNHGIGYLISHPYFVYDVSDLCLSDGISKHGGIAFKIFPNPATDQLSVEILSSVNQSNTLSLFDVSGRNLEVKLLHKNANKITLDISNLPPGTYFLQHGNAVRKFLKH